MGLAVGDDHAKVGLEGVGEFVGDEDFHGCEHRILRDAATVEGPFCDGLRAKRYIL